MNVLHNMRNSGSFRTPPKGGGGGGGGGGGSGDSFTLDLFLLQTITTYFSRVPGPPLSDY